MLPSLERDSGAYEDDDEGRGGDEMGSGSSEDDVWASRSFGRGPSSDAEEDVEQDSSLDRPGDPSFSSQPSLPSPGMDRLPAQPLRLRVEGTHAGQTKVPDLLPMVGPWVISTSYEAFPGTDCIANLQVWN